MKEDKTNEEPKDNNTNLLNNAEKAEIASDVKAAFNKAKGEPEEILSLDTLTSIDKTIDGAPDTLSQEEIDKVVAECLKAHVKAIYTALDSVNYRFLSLFLLFY